MTRSSSIRHAAIHAIVSLACAIPSSLAVAQEASPVEDSPIRGYFLFDQLEHTTTRYTGGGKRNDALRFNTAGWIGGDYNRLWLYTEGAKPYNGKLEDVDVQLLYGRLVAPFWDLQAGLRHSKPRPDGPSRNYAVLGVQGLAPYRFEVQAAAFVSERGDVSARAESTPRVSVSRQAAYVAIPMRRWMDCCARGFVRCMS